MRDKEDEARTKLIEADGDIEKFAELIRVDERTKREWVELSRDEVLDIEETTTHPLAFYQAIEQRLKELNA